VKYGVPILLGPEAVTSSVPSLRDTRALQYDEAYKEMEFYNSIGYEHAIIAGKAGLRLSVPRAEWISDMDDAICNYIPFAKRLGSGLVLLAAK
jgi:hypothetical protein